MNAFGYRPDVKITEVIQKNGFTLSAEVIPPRNGAEQIAVLEQIEALIRAGAQFLSVTKGAGGSLRGGSLPIAQSIRDQFAVPAIAHFTCRDLTIQEVENQLMDHHYFGIRNILALRGDPPEGSETWKTRNGGHELAHELIAQIRQLNQAKYLSRPTDAQFKPLEREGTDFCIGAAAYPEHPNEKERLDFYRLKIEAGAEFGITQMIFDADQYGRFLDLCERSGIDKIPLLVGTRLLNSKKAALKMTEMFKVSVPAQMIEGLPEKASPNHLNQVVDHFMKFIGRLKSLGAPGVHLFVLQDTAGSCEVLRQLKTAGVAKW